MSEKKKCPVCGKEIKEVKYPTIWDSRENKPLLIWHSEHEHDKYKEELDKLKAKIYGTK